MYYLIYVSQAHKPMTPLELSEILQKSRARNGRDGISGLLIYKFMGEDNRASFMQLLEGEREAVEAAYERIATDQRHHTKLVLEQGEIKNRNFPGWSMGFRNVESEALSYFAGFSDLGSPDFWKRAQDGQLGDALDLMKSFYDGEG